ncbi:uncharacterized protein LOC128575070 isoform X3 [Nycticebus coucang]|uniref:uncharacterized protein LOC128575070 isoform X3 n=1 Tax=Nycticebus coucang TaxID=9470 RepID=UPI00234C0CF1|nr:uncharacterized protein LOC128575070 isoform X3 [Nycticebus coucang]
MRGTFPLRASEIRSCFSDRIRTLMRLLQLEGAQLRTLLVTRTEDVPNSCNLRCFPGMCFPQKSGTVPHPQHLSQVSRRLLLPGHVFSCPPLVRLSARLEQLQAGDHWSLEEGGCACSPAASSGKGPGAVAARSLGRIPLPGFVSGVPARVPGPPEKRLRLNLKRSNLPRLTLSRPNWALQEVSGSLQRLRPPYSHPPPRVSGSGEAAGLRQPPAGSGHREQ